MAGDWIKLEHTTPDKPEVVSMAARLKIDQDAVVGKLVRIWAWADQNSVDGSSVPVTDAFIDRLANKKGFAAAMRATCWLSGESCALTFTDFGRHNGSTAKARAESNRRMAKSRAGAKTGEQKRNTSDDIVADFPQQKPQPEKRREEDNTPKAPKGADGGGIQTGPNDGGGVPASVRQTYPPALAPSAEFIKCWEGEWLPYLLEKKGRMPAIITTDKQLLTCARLGPTKAIAGLRSAIEKGWSAPDENAKVTNGAHFDSVREWEMAPDDWKAIWREKYPPEDFPDAPRYEDGAWADVRMDHKKHIHELAKAYRRQQRAG
jgi:hypothetical protein